jgi:hypothetical protein
VTDLKAEIVVYHDSSLPSVWIDKSKQYPQKIASAFSKKGVKILDALSLKSFILEALNNGTANQKLIVFSQDVTPDSIVESNSSSNTLRQYLDAGGSVLWIGDIPLYYKGEAKKEKPTVIGDSGAPIEILGVIPIFSIPKKSVSFTYNGKRIGLRTSWSGMRPVLQDKEISALARSESVLCRYYIDIKKKKGILGRLGDKIRTIQSVQAMGVGIKLGEEDGRTSQGAQTQTQQALPHIHETHVNAWVKCFNSNYPKSGFYRIWDFPPITLTDNMVAELVEVSQSISRRIARASQVFWLRA